MYGPKFNANTQATYGAASATTTPSNQVIGTAP
jgi:hypothetical protein